MKGTLSKTLNDSEQLVLKLLAGHRYAKPSGEAHFLAVSTQELLEDAKKIGEKLWPGTIYGHIRTLHEKGLINIRKRKIPCQGSLQKFSACTLKINKSGQRILANEMGQENPLASPWDPQI